MTQILPRPLPPYLQLRRQPHFYLSWARQLYLCHSQDEKV